MIESVNIIPKTLKSSLAGTRTFMLAKPLVRFMARSVIPITDSTTRALSMVFLVTSVWIRRYVR